LQETTGGLDFSPSLTKEMSDRGKEQQGLSDEERRSEVLKPG